jgi:hypothetical protein
MAKALPGTRREWTFAIASAAIGGGVIYAIEVWFHPHQLPENIGGIGDFLTGIGTLLLVLVAFLGIQRWEDEHTKKLQAEVAGEVLDPRVESLDRITLAGGDPCRSSEMASRRLH